MSLKIRNEKPPIWEQVIKAGMHPSIASTIFTYGDIIFVPSGQALPDHLVEHESVHSKQQGDDPDAWWHRYIEDAYFRIAQETEAYATQYRFICQAVKDRNRRFSILNELAEHLSSPTYGSVITRQDALQMIKQKANI